MNSEKEEAEALIEKFKKNNSDGVISNLVQHLESCPTCFEKMRIAYAHIHRHIDSIEALR